MSDEPRFPPPRGEEPVGYREAGAPISDEKPELPVPSESSIVVQRRRVVASRPDDPEIALAKAFTPPRRKPVQASSVGIVLFLVFVVIVAAFQIAASRQSRHRLRTPASVAT